MQRAVTGASSRTTWRRIIGLVVMAIMLLALLFGGFVFLPQRLTGEPPSPFTTAVSLSADPQTALSVTEQDVSQPSPAHQQTPSDPAPDDEMSPLVAIVNDVAIEADALDLQTAADRAMADLSGQQPDETIAERIVRLINGELVWQQALIANRVVSVARSDEQLDQLLNSYDRSQADLDRSLTAAGLSRAEFYSYFQRLLTIDRFAAEQASIRGITTAEYLRTLQDEAYISYGALSEEVDAEAVTEPAADPAQPLEKNLKVDTSAAYTVPTASREPTSKPVAQETRLRSTAIGQLAPLFDVPLLGSEGENVELVVLSGNPVLISFWTTWCPYCRRQAPVLIEAYEQYSSQGLQIVGINVKEKGDKVTQYVEENGIPYPVGLDEQGYAANAYAVSGYPTTYFLDADGRVVGRHVGTLTTETIQQIVEPLLQ